MGRMIRVMLVTLIWFEICSPVFAADEDIWRKVTDWDLSIVPNSALDFSALVAGDSAGKNGSISIRPDGTFGFISNPDRPVRFFCAAQPYGVAEGFPDHATADIYARQLRMHGYNLARFTFVDNMLMNGRNADFDFDPVQLDRFHYFLAALKGEGIYGVIDGLTSWNAAYGDVGGNRWAKQRNVKLGIYHDPNQKAHWKELVSRLLGGLNRYTGLRLLEDSALVGVILVNEGELNYLINKNNSPEMDLLFEKWLAARYGSIEKAKRNWSPLDSATSLTRLPRNIWMATAKVTDAQRFYYELQTETTQWMTNYVRGLGYKGLVTAFDSGSTVQDHATRAGLSWVDFHRYHDHPSNFVTPGSRINQSSSLKNGLEYVRDAATSRYWGKPLTLTEYDQPFWNRWRFESGLAMGAYGAFQGWDLLCRYGNGPIELTYGITKDRFRKAMHPFGIGMDPVARAGETLAALLYLRRDVQLSKKRIGINLTPNYVFDQRGGIGKLPDDITYLGLITGIGLLWEGAKINPTLDSVLDPGGVSPTLTNKLIGKVGLGSESRLPAFLASLRKRGILSNNRSNGQTLFESDTREISLDIVANTLKVITQRTEAVAFASAPGRLNVMNVIAATGSAMVSASSLDGLALDQSRRILLILATDARNSGMKFSDSDEKELVSLGEIPILMRSIRVDLSLEHKRPEALSLYVLRLNGDRAGKLPLNVIAGSSISFRLDTRTPDFSPTTFFEIIEE